jgi:hypothetical protein
VVTILTVTGEGKSKRSKCGADCIQRNECADRTHDTDVPELVHWHGLMIPSEVDGRAEQGTPHVPPHGMRRMDEPSPAHSLA